MWETGTILRKIFGLQERHYYPKRIKRPLTTVFYPLLLAWNKKFRQFEYHQKPSPEINMYRSNGHVCPVRRKSPKYFFYSSCVEKQQQRPIVHVQKYEILKIQTSTVFEKKELDKV